MRLPSVLLDGDVTSPELQAARLDGEVYGVGELFCLIDEVETPALRARAVCANRSDRLIAELGTAAWIWGAAAGSSRLEFAVAPGARTRQPPLAHLAVREIVFADDDLADLDGFRVTTPLRTAVDLARFRDTFPAETVTRLAEVARFTFEDCVEVLESRPGMPAKLRAVRRLATVLTPNASVDSPSADNDSADGAYAVETRYTS